jgi:hypothetical protein
VEETMIAHAYYNGGKLQNHLVARKMFMYSEDSEEKRKNNGEADEH